MSCGNSVSVNMRLNMLADTIKNRIETDTWPVSPMTSQSFRKLKRRFKSAMSIAPSAPAAPASVGVKMPP